MASGQLIDLLGDSSTDVAAPTSPSKSVASGADLLGDIDFLDPMSPQGSMGVTSADASAVVDEQDGAWDVEEGAIRCLFFFAIGNALSFNANLTLPYYPPTVEAFLKKRLGQKIRFVVTILDLQGVSLAYKDVFVQFGFQYKQSSAAFSTEGLPNTGETLGFYHAQQVSVEVS